METIALELLPGFRRRFVITPAPRWVRAELEDDYHGMSVTVRHARAIATAIEPVMSRVPWTTCPGAVEQLKQTFSDVPLHEFAARGEKRINCTHLHDLAVMAAAHAFDAEPLVYDVLVSDPIEGQRRAELRRNGVPVFNWIDANGRIVAPSKLAGVALDQLQPWIKSLDPSLQEAARVLRLGALIANGRTIPWERQSDASRMLAGSCYTFQLSRMAEARRIRPEGRQS